MADEESPYESLDIGYVEWPMPSTQELSVIRFLDKTGVADLWTKINDKFFKIPYGGKSGQVLTKTDTGYSWGDQLTGDFIEEPSGGNVGQALIKTETGVGWGDVETDIPEASDTEYGTVRFATDKEFDSYFNNPQGEGNLALNTRAVSLYQLKRVLSGKRAESLPEGYIELDYVDIPKDQYLVTDLKTNQNTRIDMSSTLLSTPKNNTGCFFFGSAYPSQQNGIECYCWYDATNTPRINVIYNGNIYYSPGSVKEGDKLHIDWHDQIVTIYQNDSLVCNYAWPSQSYTSAGNLTLFGLARSGQLYAGQIRVYTTKVYENDTLVLDLIPTKTSSGEVGFYNIVNGSFYGNSGTGSFIAGPEVIKNPYSSIVANFTRTLSAFSKLPEIELPVGQAQYEVLNYLIFDGHTLIDTGYKANSNSGVQAKIYFDSSQPTANNNVVAVFGSRSSSTDTANSNSYSCWSMGSSFRFDYASTQNTVSVRPLGDVAFTFNRNSATINSVNYTPMPKVFQSANTMRIASTYTTGAGFYEGQYYDNRRFAGKLYYFKILESGLLKRDFVPVKRLSDGALGLFDKVENKFYENAGTGSFGAGTKTGEYIED